MEFVERKIIFHGSHFVDFYLEQTTKVQEKIEFVFQIIKKVGRVSRKFLSPIENSDGLYEIRVQLGSNIFRIFCFFDQGQLVILANGFQKKTQKTPKKEIVKALIIMKECNNEKESK